MGPAGPCRRRELVRAGARGPNPGLSEIFQIISRTREAATRRLCGAERASWTPRVLDSVTREASPRAPLRKASASRLHGEVLRRLTARVPVANARRDLQPIFSAGRR